MSNVEAAYSSFKTVVSNTVSFSESEWAEFSQHWSYKNYDKGAFIIQPPSVERYFYFVYSGVFRAFVINQGADISIGFSYNGDYSGAYDSFLSQSPTDMYIQALSDAHVLRITYQSLMTMFDKYKWVERWGRILNANILIGIGRRQVEVRSYTAEERFERLFNQSPHIFQLVPQKHLASYLGMTPETFSRMRKAIMRSEKKT